MSDNSKWIGKIFENRNLLTHLLLSVVGFLLGLLLLVSGVVKFFPPINPYGYALSNGAGNILLITGSILIIGSTVLYILGTGDTRESAQQIRGGISYLYLRQYLLNRVSTKSDIINKLNDFPTPKSIMNISYLLNETPSEIMLLRSVSSHLLLLLEEESEPSISTEIVEILGKTKIPNTEKILIGHYKDKEVDYPDLQKACITALGELGTTKARKALEKLLESPHKLVGNFLNTINNAMKKILVLSEFTLLLKSQLFDERIARYVRETYILPALEDIGTKETISIIGAYLLSKMEGIEINSAYKQVISKQTKEDKNDRNF